MKIIIDNIEKYKKKNKKKLVSVNILNKEYEVYAMIKRSKIVYCLLFIDNQLKYIDIDSVKIIDETIPNNWIKKTYDKEYKIKKYYDLFGYDYISFSEYNGPIEFINNEYFLLNINDYPNEAKEFFLKYLKKDKSRER